MIPSRIHRAVAILMLTAQSLALWAGDLNAAFYDNLGYKVQSVVVSTPSAWYEKEFGTQGLSLTSIKSTAQVKGEPNWYYRFVIHVEDYPDELHAQQRVKRLREASPKEQENKAFPLRKAFAHQRKVYIVTTDVNLYMLDGELDRVLDALNRHVTNMD